jgi:hypothetical protein
MKKQSEDHIGLAALLRVDAFSDDSAFGEYEAAYEDKAQTAEILDLLYETDFQKTADCWLLAVNR